MIEQSEVPERSRADFARYAQRAGVDPSKPVRIDTYLSARKQQERGQEVHVNLMPFGDPARQAKAAGFDTPLTEEEIVLLDPDRPRPPTSLLISASNNPPEDKKIETKQRSSGDYSSDVNAKVGKMFEWYDKNKNRVLDKEEWGKDFGDTYDADNDGKITHEEIEASMKKSRDDKDSSSKRSREKPRTEAAGEQRSDGRTYRFSSPLDRLDKDARGWVAKFDDNRDGQVSMAEFSRSWSDSKIREFEKYDADDDGVVTGAEFLNSGKR